MKTLRITLEGKTYDVTVEELDDTVVPAPHLTHAAPPSFQPAPAAAPAVSTPKPVAAPVAAGCSVVVCPMAGLVFKCLVKPGDVVTVNQVVIVLDAMKMETPVVAPLAGTVRAVLVKVGDAVDEGSSLLQIEG
jgi:glutaconyl-CoA/methylmalonyl-CoA decarboxylase subunit gamma